MIKNLVEIGKVPHYYTIGVSSGLNRG